MAWSRLQSASATNGGSPVAATFTTANLSSGTKIIVGLAVESATGGTDDLTSVVLNDTAATALTKLASIGTNNESWLYLLAVDTPSDAVGTKPTVTATWNTADHATFGMTILAQEVSGLLSGNTSAMLDGTAGTNSGTSTGPATSGSYSSTASSEYLVALYGDAGDGVTVTDSSGYTADPNEINASSNATLMFNYKNSGNTAESASFTLSGSAHWNTILVAFKLGGPVITSGPLLGLQALVQAPVTVPSVSGWRNAGHSR